MNREELRASILANLASAGVSKPEVRVQPDPDGRWRVAVISATFRGRPLQERREVTLRDLDVSAVAWIDLLTPEEREWAGSLPADVEPEQLPLWPEAFARGEAPVPGADIVFASDLDEDIELPIVATFYSLRGGVGRSTALAYTARILADRGRKVVCVDMDLEAPGLAALFGCEDQVPDGRGLATLLLALEAGDSPDVSRHLLRVVEGEDLYLLPAGRPDAEYARCVRLIDPGGWYREESNPLRTLLQRLETGLPFRPDVVLFDARTGLSPLSGPLLFDLADIAVIAFFPHPQAYVGTRALVQALLASHSRREFKGRRLTPAPRFLVSPLPASKAPEIVQKYEHRAIERIAEWLEPAKARHTPLGALVEKEITHFVPYREALATSDQILAEPEAWRDFEPLAEWIERFLPTRSEQRQVLPVSLAKPQILAALRFSSGTAEQQDDFLSTFVETDTARRAVDRDMPLVVGRKGTGKTAIFRWLDENPGLRTVVVTAPASLRKDRAWLIGQEGFREVETVLASQQADWAQFWAYSVGVALSLSAVPRMSTGTSGDAALDVALEKPLAGDRDVVDTLHAVVSRPQSGLLLQEWLARLDRQAGEPVLLLFDGLDTGFGTTESDRVRRRRALEGLFSFWADREATFGSLRFKILLREDIWRSLRFDNKSHLFGRLVTLKWNNQASFLKVALKHALRSEAFTTQLESLVPGRVADLSTWTDSDVFAAWNLLVGERMKGGNTTFTRNWVWNRLADANEDHSPRHLLQLFQEALKREREEHKRSPYERSLLRPRSLSDSLPEVSNQALVAFQEEFPELTPLLDRLRGIGRTPVKTEDLAGDGAAEQLTLAREVGLLAPYEEVDEVVSRYKVPELYRWALSMTRMGQT